MEWVQDWLSFEPFAGVSEKTGLRVDEINYVFCMLLAYPLAFLFRLVPTSLPALRHFIAGFVGLLFGVFCFRVFILHVFVLAGVAYLFIILDPSAKSVHRNVAVFSIGYLTFCHIYRQYYFFGLYLLDITGPLMLLVQKLSSLGYSLHDAQHPSDKQTELQKKLAVAKTPTLLEYFGHVFFFPAFLAGPMHFFTDYKAFMEGHTHTEGGAFAAAKKFVYAFLCMGCNRLPGFLGIDNSMLLLANEKWIDENNILRRLAQLYMASVCIRMQYYFAWILAEGANNAAGFGFQKKKDSKDGSDDKEVKGSWHLITNVRVENVEFATNLKGVLDNWNIQTSTWLRYVCYERTNNSVNKTMLLSALWHGLYPGYFLTFLTGTLQTEAARTGRRVIRPIFHSAGKLGMHVYDVLTWVVTAIALDYMVGPFVILEFWASLQFWSDFHFAIHILCFLMLLLPKGKSDKAKGDRQTPGRPRH